jgi:hypothetical protein
MEALSGAHVERRNKILVENQGDKADVGPTLSRINARWMA